jgi:cation diffusion facilitator CzcD-associated flavoprotein CzcO/acetyl esterase/lipase
MRTDQAGRFRLPPVVLRALVRLTLRPVLSAGVPPRLQRRLLELSSVLLPGQRARAHRTVLGQVPVSCVTAGRPAGPAADPAGPAVVLYLHGGGFTTGSARAYRPLAAALARAGDATVYLVDYRLAPEHPHPAALDDTLAAYRALLAGGVPAGRIVLAGDSAGGHLALAAALRLRDAGDPLPAGLALISPWLDLAGPAAPPARGRRDPLLAASWLRFCAGAYLAGTDPADRAVAPLSADLAGLPPLHVQAGADELLVGDADRLVDRARAAGVAVGYDRWPGMWHNFQIFTGLLAAADQAVDALGQAIRSWLPPARPGPPATPRVVIVGAGFGGIGTAIELTRHGFRDFVVLDKADRIGGVWRENTYPGAACDVPSVQYCYSYQQRADWPRRFSGQADILAYLGDCVRQYGLADHLRLGVEVTDASHDGRAWTLRTAGGDEISADVLVFACGQLSRPSYPDIPGLDRFAGRMFHSAHWDHRHDLTDRQVAVIGTGSSALQFVPQIARQAARLTVFQRTAGWVLPKLDGPLSPRQQRRYRRWPGTMSAARRGWDLFEEGLTFGITRNRAVLAPLRLISRAMLRRQVHDPAVRRKLTPAVEFGCKRIGFSTDWYPTFNLSTVELVTTPIDRVTETGVHTADGRLSEVDTIILGTGFAATEFLAPIRVSAGGRELADAWCGGARAYLGITVPGFPNLFLIYGPNTNLGSGSIIHMMEGQARYVRQAVELLAAGGARQLEVRPDVAEAYDLRTQQRLAGTAWVSCRNWYRTSTGRVVNNWPGQLREYRRLTDRFDRADYRTDPPPGG